MEGAGRRDRVRTRMTGWQREDYLRIEKWGKKEELKQKWLRGGGKMRRGVGGFIVYTFKKGDGGPPP